MYANVSFRAGSSEFPHDNPALDECAVWIGSALCALEWEDGEAPQTVPASQALDLDLSESVEPLEADPSADSGIMAQGPGGEASTPVPTGEVTLDAPVEALIEELVAAVLAAPIDTPALVESEVSDAADSTAAPVAVLALETPAAEERPAATVASVESKPAPFAAQLEPIPVPVDEPEPQMPETDAFTTFVRAVSDVAGNHGGADAAAHTRYLLVSGCPAPRPLDPDAEHALVAGNILRADADGAGAAEGFWELASVWQRVLRGEEQDLSRCGDSTLDNWAADLVARVVASPAKATSIRRDLRRRGVAAFGLFDAAH